MKKDYFSTQSTAYKTFRPLYPENLFEFLCRDLASECVVWDCATGNGQAALALRNKVSTVVASDQSAAQLANAPQHDGIYYLRSMAERIPLRSHSIDLVTVAQALHWFDFDRFYAEVRRVLRPGGRIAVWTYSFLSVSPQLGEDVDAVIKSFYHDVIGPYWPPERCWVDEHYRSIPFPFDELDTPSFSIEVEWDLNATFGYMGSWSAVQQYVKATGRDPLPLLKEELALAWGKPTRQRRLSWALGLRVGRSG
jgi:SAM-dependent methyltransferase